MQHSGVHCSWLPLATIQSREQAELRNNDFSNMFLGLLFSLPLYEKYSFAIISESDRFVWANIFLYRCSHIFIET